jgi:hypothetical protein
MNLAPTSLSRSARIRRSAAQCAAAIAIGGLIGASTLPAVAQEAGNQLEQVMNSPEAKNDRAGAPTGNNLVGIKTAAANDVAKRKRLLDRLTNQLAAAEVDCGQNVALATRLAETEAVLDGIAGQIAAATDVKTARAAAGELYPNTRVYSLVAPQVEVALSCARAEAQVDRLEARITSLQQWADANKSVPDAAAVSAAVPTLIASLKTVPSLVPTSAAVAVLLPDRGDATIANNNAAALTQARAQVKANDAALDATTKAVREAEKLSDRLGKRKGKQGKK